MANRLSQLDRTPGNIEPKEKYKGENKKGDLDVIASNLKQKEDKALKKEKINNQKNSIKCGDDVRAKIDAQKQIEDVKFDYKFLDILLERNASNFSQKEKAKYNILMGEDF